MRLYVHVQLDSGGAINISGDSLSAEDVNEVFAILAGKTISSQSQVTEPFDTPLSRG